MLEAELQKAVVDCAHLFGWLVHHTRPARTNKGWRTPLQGDKGFFDLVLARYPAQGERQMILIELKSERGKLSPEQDAWLHAIPVSIPCYVWFPEDWTNGKVEAILR